MKTLVRFTLVVLFIFCYSCNDDDDLYVSSGDNYVEISLNGENLTVYSGGSSYFLSEETSSEKPCNFDQIVYIETSKYTFALSLYHYSNFQDFVDSETGIYSIYDTVSSAFNLDMFVHLEDETEPDQLTSLIPGAKHKVVDLSNLGDEIPSTYLNGSVKYKIKGELNNMTFRNKSNEDIIVSVKYEAFISLFK